MSLTFISMCMCIHSLSIMQTILRTERTHPKMFHPQLGIVLDCKHDCKHADLRSLSCLQLSSRHSHI